MPPVLWFARGLIFENCTCTLVCPGHMHFSQNCTTSAARATGPSASMRGASTTCRWTALRRVIVFDTPQRMIDGGWTQTLIIDAAHACAAPGDGDDPHRPRVRTVGEAGERSSRRTSRPSSVPIDIADEDTAKRVSIVDRLTGVDRADSRPRQVEARPVREHLQPDPRARAGAARGDTDYDDGASSFTTAGSHGLFSTFEWVVGSDSDRDDLGGAHGHGANAIGLLSLIGDVDRHDGGDDGAHRVAVAAHVPAAEPPVGRRGTRHITVALRRRLSLGVDGLRVRGGGAAVCVLARRLARWTTVRSCTAAAPRCFIGAGLFQFTPWKRACLTHCRNPLSFLLARWHNGPIGGYRLGLHHGCSASAAAGR